MGTQAERDVTALEGIRRQHRQAELNTAAILGAARVKERLAAAIARGVDKGNAARPIRSVAGTSADWHRPGVEGGELRKGASTNKWLAHDLEAQREHDARAGRPRPRDGGDMFEASALGEIRKIHREAGRYEGSGALVKREPLEHDTGPLAKALRAGAADLEELAKSGARGVSAERVEEQRRLADALGELPCPRAAFNAPGSESPELVRAEAGSDELMAAARAGDGGVWLDRLRTEALAKSFRLTRVRLNIGNEPPRLRGVA